MVKTGSRVIAIRDSNHEIINLYGFGIYEGYQKVPEELALYPGQTNTRIKLDNGHVVWGFQCWWGSEEKQKKFIGDRKVILVFDEPAI
jgi:hypothetical protein